MSVSETELTPSTLFVAPAMVNQVECTQCTWFVRGDEGNMDSLSTEKDTPYTVSVKQIKTGDGRDMLEIFIHGFSSRSGAQWFPAREVLNTPDGDLSKLPGRSRFVRVCGNGLPVGGPAVPVRLTSIPVAGKTLVNIAVL
ncbi:MAG: hypothetical protein J0L64_14560 [Acidobacteria bacterium]|nr:hypothetical protein [Acidobacteriota bacterium]